MEVHYGEEAERKFRFILGSGQDQFEVIVHAKDFPSAVFWLKSVYGQDCNPKIPVFKEHN